MTAEQQRADSSARQRHAIVTTFGHGVATATPDRMQVSISIETRAEAVAVAYGRAGERTAAVTAALRADGVAASDIATTGLSVRTETTWTENEGTRITGYVATTSLTVSLRIPGAPTASAADLGTATTARPDAPAPADPAAVIARAVEAGGDDVRLGGLNLAVADRADLLIRAREAAWDDALDRARRYAARAGRSLGSVLEITENAERTPEPRGDIRFVAARSAAPGAPVPVEYGEHEVTADLRATWHLA
ncbi:SIMPL domain-containing protein [Nocardia sp. BSTN01]|uniref:SIMPL domain-containing protein n=1 Tax=Nocardia sp. BSTN01 TaxID=2783665 RepID=UPI00188DE162|nr:SIMPL domain-containing protein [Nocardia sp. BSTN01]MBF4998617.1 SIMPL domain-containing protein [Nocardia sp. BSTN01]